MLKIFARIGRAVVVALILSALFRAAHAAGTPDGATALAATAAISWSSAART